MTAIIDKKITLWFKDYRVLLVIACWLWASDYAP